MKRPVLVTVALVLESLLTLALAGVAIYLVWLAHSPEIRAEADAADAVRGLMIGAVATGGPAIVAFISCWGLWRNKRWGWWVAMAMHVIVVATLALGIFDENSVDVEDLIVTLCFLVFPIFLLLPKVRKFYWHGEVSQQTSAPAH